MNKATLRTMQVILPANNFKNMSNIIGVVVADKNLGIMSKNVKAAGLELELSKQGPFTVFAPTDLAFGKLAEGELPELLKPENKVKLADLLNHHVVAGRISFRELTDGQKLKTIGGKELDVKVVDGKVSINGSKVQGRDSNASNGIVHSVDTVMTIK